MPWTDIPNPAGLSEFKKFTFSVDNHKADVPEPLPRALNFAWLVNGPPGSGKSNFILNLLCRPFQYYNRQFDRVFLISPSQKSTAKDYWQSLPEDQRYYEFNEEVLQEILDEIAESGDKVLIILDDVVAQLKKNMPTLLRFLYNRRHVCGPEGCCAVMITSQVLNKVPLEIRKVMTHVCTFYMASKKEKDSFYEDYASSALGRPEYEDLLRYVFDRKHNFLMFDTATNGLYKNFNKLAFHGGRAVDLLEPPVGQ